MSDYWRYMTPSDKIVGYTFDADQYGPDCLAAMFARDDMASMSAEQVLNVVARERGIDRDDESSFDSGEFPKVILSVMVEGDDDRCGHCGIALNDH